MQIQESYEVEVIDHSAAYPTLSGSNEFLQTWNLSFSLPKVLLQVSFTRIRSDWHPGTTVDTQKCFLLTCTTKYLIFLTGPTASARNRKPLHILKPGVPHSSIFRPILLILFTSNQLERLQRSSQVGNRFHYQPHA